MSKRKTEINETMAIVTGLQNSLFVLEESAKRVQGKLRMMLQEECIEKKPLSQAASLNEEELKFRLENQKKTIKIQYDQMAKDAERISALENELLNFREKFEVASSQADEYRKKSNRLAIELHTAETKTLYLEGRLSDEKSADAGLLVQKDVEIKRLTDELHATETKLLKLTEGGTDFFNTLRCRLENLGGSNRGLNAGTYFQRDASGSVYLNDVVEFYKRAIGVAFEAKSAILYLGAQLREARAARDAAETKLKESSPKATLEFTQTNTYTNAWCALGVSGWYRITKLDKGWFRVSHAGMVWDDEFPNYDDAVKACEHHHVWARYSQAQSKLRG